MIEYENNSDLKKHLNFDEMLKDNKYTTIAKGVYCLLILNFIHIFK